MAKYLGWRGLISAALIFMALLYLAPSLSGELPPGATATDMVLRITEMLRETGVVEKFVEFFGPGTKTLSVPDRATVANMAPEYGATCGFFPIDADTVAYLKATGRDAHQVALVETYGKAQGLYRSDDKPAPAFTATVSLDLATVVPSLAGPKRPQDRIALSHADTAFDAALAGFRDVNLADEAADMDEEGGGSAPSLSRTAAVAGKDYELSDGDVVIAAITSCTNTSNPSALIAAGLIARKAREKGLTSGTEAPKEDGA